MQQLAEYGGRSAEASDTATTGTSGTAPAMVSLWLERRLITPAFVITDDSRRIAMILVHTRPEDRAFNVAIERAPDDGGSPDTNAINRIAHLPGVTGPQTPRRFGEPLAEIVHEDPRPISDAVWWYRALHVRDEWTDGEPTPWVAVSLEDLDDADELLHVLRIRIPFWKFFAVDPSTADVDKSNDDHRAAGTGSTDIFADFELPPGARQLLRLRSRTYAEGNPGNGSVNVVLREASSGTGTDLATVVNGTGVGMGPFGVFTVKEAPEPPVDLDPNGSYRLNGSIFCSSTPDARMDWVELHVLTTRE